MELTADGRQIGRMGKKPSPRNENGTHEEKNMQKGCPAEGHGEAQPNWPEKGEQAPVTQRPQEGGRTLCCMEAISAEQVRKNLQKKNLSLPPTEEVCVHLTQAS